jgi:hypothetical protein
MTELPQLLLDHHLKTLKLPTILREYDKVVRRREKVPPGRHEERAP